VHLIERDTALSQLGDALQEVRSGGSGRLVLVSGEAGSGKTSLTRAFTSSVPPDVLVRWGACDHLHTPRPLGPVLEVVGGFDLLALPRERVFSAVTEVLAGAAPCVAVVEDAHWADEATLDVLSYLGRRVLDLPVLLIVTYRADELAAGHPLRIMLGELATSRPLRLSVEPLSRAGVEELARPYGVDAGELHSRTRGNAFFVTECLATSADALPETVRDAVLARLGQLSPPARAALEAASVVPGPVEYWLLDTLSVESSALDTCIERGVLVGGDRVSFRHELARLAVLDTLLPGRRRALHTAITSALSRPPVGTVDHARLAHHAEEAGDVDTVLASGPLAARAAAAVGARREAAAHLERTLRHEERIAPEDRLQLLSDLSMLLQELGHHEDAIAAYERAVTQAEVLGDPRTVGKLLARMWSSVSMAGHLQRAESVVDRAVTLLEPLGPSRALALAYAQRCSQHMLARELTAARPWGERAVTMARELADHETTCYALAQSGIARWMNGDDGGLDGLRDGVELAREHGYPSLVVHGLSQIGSGGGEVRRYPEAVVALQECVEYAERFELGSRGMYSSAWLARCDVEQGRWRQAADRLDMLMRSSRNEGVTRITTLTALGRLRARRGDPGVWPLLDEALAMAERTGHLQRLWPVVAARCEAAWLDGRLADELPTLTAAHELAMRRDSPWARGELGFWLWRAGVLGPLEPGAALPFALHVAGEVRAAAAAWTQLGCPYEEADALADSTDPDDLRRAYDVFIGLGARPAAQRAVGAMRHAGVRVPRGPLDRTRSNPAGLTDREVEILPLIASGRTNAEIAARLQISVKTVGHHVSHVLAKLDVRTRAEAVTAAIALGIDVTSPRP
jgi:DNA-binding CsgD family transcriptional regulator/tetratricopeptide (TPR) repeat protein